MSETFDILFRGDIQPGSYLPQVKEDLARLMKVDVDAVAKLFSGRAERLKRQVDAMTAEKYRRVLEGIGMVVEIRAHKATATSPKVVSPVKKQVVDKHNERSSNSGAAPEIGAPEGEGLTVAPPGAEVLDERDRVSQRPSPVSVETDHLSVNEPSGNLVEDDERPEVDEIAVDLSAYSVAESGESLLSDSERTEFVPLDVDLSAITLASEEAENNQIEQDGTPVPIPDIGYLSLSDDLSGVSQG